MIQKQPRISRHDFVARVAFTLALAAGMTACGAVPESGSEPGDDAVSTAEQPFINSFTFGTSCTPQAQARVRAAGAILNDAIYTNQGRDMKRCLMDSFVSYQPNAEWAGLIWAHYNRATTTEIFCHDNIAQACAGTTGDWWGCAGPTSTESMRLANQMLFDKEVSVRQTAALIAHELAHNYGYTHPSTGSSEYTLSVPERVRACIANELSLPWPQGRSTDGSVFELGPVGRWGGTPNEAFCSGTGFVRGLKVRSNSVLTGLMVQCEGELTPEWMFGGSSGVVSTLSCPTGQVLRGITGRADGGIHQLQPWCGDPGSSSSSLIASVGSPSGILYEAHCPDGASVKSVRLRSSSVIDQLQLVCMRGRNTYSIPFAQGTVRGTPSGTTFAQRCPEKNGRITRLVGSSGNRVDRLSFFCGSQPAVPYAGGGGGGPFSSSCTDANPNGIVVGLRTRSGVELDAIAPICSDSTQWLTSPTRPAVWVGTQVGGTGGSLATTLCPLGTSVGGLDVTWGSLVNSVQVLCR